MGNASALLGRASILLLLAVSGTQAHRPHLDDGTHTSLSTSWVWPDTSIARILMTTQDCPSAAVWTKVAITNISATVAVSVGIPNATTL